MENNLEVNETGATDAKQKKTVQRSASYPFITIQEAVEFVITLHKSYPNTTITREDANAIAENVGYTNRNLASSKQYNLLKLAGENGYAITESFFPLYKYIDEAERRKALLEAFYSPKLYQALIASYDGHAIPTELPTILFRKYGIAEKASEKAAEIFIENGKYVGAIDERNILKFSQSREKTSATQYAEIITERFADAALPPKVDLIETDTQQAHLLPPSFNNVASVETEIINLSGGRKVSIVFPSDILEREIILVEKRLEEIKLRLQINKEGTD